MDNKQVTAEWIAQQRAVCGNVKRLNLFSLAEADKIFKVDMPAALDALEAAQKEIARLTAELSAVTRERDAAVDDIGQIMRACPTDYRPCDWCADYPNGVCYNRTTYAGCTACEPVWRGPCALHGDEKGV